MRKSTINFWICLKNNEKKLVRSFNFTFRYIDDVLSLNNSRFGDFVNRIYPIELEIKDTTDTDRSVSYLDLHLDIDSEGRLRTKLHDFTKEMISIFPSWTFHSYVATFQQHLHMEYISLSWNDILELVGPIRKLLNQGFLVKLKSSLRKFYGRHHDLVDRFGISVWQKWPFTNCGNMLFVLCFWRYDSAAFLHHDTNK